MGVFVYRGGAMDTEFIPGVQASDEYGNKIVNKKTRKKVWEREPKLVRHEIAVYRIGGVESPLEFPKGEQVMVESEALAAKLRTLGFFDELEAVAVVEEGEPPKKRGRPKKSGAESAVE